MDMKQPTNNGRTAFFFFFRQVNAWINWRSWCSPSKGAICISLSATASAKAGLTDIGEWEKEEQEG